MGKKIFKKLPSGIIPIIVLEFILASLIAAYWYVREIERMEPLNPFLSLIVNMLMTIWVLLFIGGSGFSEFWESSGFDFDRSWILLILCIGTGFLVGELVFRFSSAGGMITAGVLPFPYVQASLKLSDYFTLSALNTLWVGIAEEILAFLFIASWSNFLAEKLNLGFWSTILIGTVLGRVNWAVLHFKSYQHYGIGSYIAAVFLGIVFTFSGWFVDVLGNYIRGISLKPRKLEFLIVSGIIAHFWYDYRYAGLLAGIVSPLARAGLAVVGLG